MIIRLFAIAVGFTKTNSIYDLLFISYEYTPMLVFPLWSGVLGLKPDKHAFYIAAGVTTVVLFLAKLLLPTAQSHFTVFISLAANGIVFFGIHAVRNKGFVVVNTMQEQNYFRRPRHEAFLKRFKNLLPNFGSTIQYSHIHSVTEGGGASIAGSRRDPTRLSSRHH